MEIKTEGIAILKKYLLLQSKNEHNMKLYEANIDKENKTLYNVFAFHIGMTEDMEEDDQFEWITEGLIQDKNIEILTKEEYEKARVMLCDIALNYFKRAVKPRVRSPGSPASPASPDTPKV